MTIALIARLVLAGVFAVAAFAKLADRRGTRDAVVGFGAPERLAGALAIALPLAELAVAALLLPSSTAVAGALGALVLLALFSIAIAVGLARGKAPDCHCFGQLHSSPAGWRTLARNGALLAIAAVALAGSAVDEPASAVAWVGDLSGSELLALVVAVAGSAVIVAGALVLTSLMRSYGRVLTRLDRVEEALANAGLDLEEEFERPEIGLVPGTPVPAFTARSAGGGEITQAVFTESGHPTLLLFTSTHCGPCTAFLPTVAGWQHEYAGRLSVIVASTGPAAEIRDEAELHELDRVVLDEDGRLADLFQSNGTPSAVLVSPNGRIASRVASGGEWIGQLVEEAVGEQSDGLPVGAEVPALELTSLEGETVSLHELRGRDSLLLFWNPGCGFCRSMHEDLLEWETSANGVHPRLVVVSSGDAESTRAEGFRSPVLLDEEYEAGAAFGANGTPMAVLLDADGRVGSPVVAGADAVLELANAHVPA